MRTDTRCPQSDAHSGDSGFTLVETAVALSLSLIVAVGLLSMDVITTKQTENFGHQQARTTEYAQDKIEQLMSLPFSNITANTVPTVANPIGINLLTGGTGLAVGGGLNPAAPVPQYVDYFTQAGVPTTGADWYYIRLWQISLVPGSTTLKQISVMSAIRMAYGGGQLQSTTLTALKSSPF